MFSQVHYSVIIWPTAGLAISSQVVFAIAHLKRGRLEGQLQRLSDTDPLTGVANRRHFMRELARERAHAQVELSVLSGAHDSPVSLSVSIGVAPLRVEDISDLDLFGRADTALYQAKEIGRNRVMSSEAASGEAPHPDLT